MEQGIRADFIAAGTEEPRVEIQDFDRVVRIYRPAIFRFILASLRDRDAAETLTQDCLLRAYRCRNGFRGDAAVKTWLMQIAVNLVRDQSRNRRLRFWRQTQTTSVDPQELVDSAVAREISPEQRTLLNERVQAIWNATAELSERQRTVFLLRFVEEMDLAEIAVTLGASEGTVKVHLFRALRSIRERLGRL